MKTFNQFVTEAINRDDPNFKYDPNNPKTIEHRRKTAMELLNHPKTDPETKQRASEIIARLTASQK